MNCRDPDARTLLARPPAPATGGKDPEEKEKSLLNATRNPIEAALFGGNEAPTTPTTGEGVEAFDQERSSLGPLVARFRADLPLAILAAFVAVFLGVLAADPALAQQGGGTGSEINNAITQLSSWLATLVVSLGGVALLIAVIVWLFSGSDSKRREGAVRWIGSIIVAIFVGLSVPAIISLIQSFAGGGGGG